MPISGRDRNREELTLVILFSPPIKGMFSPLEFSNLGFENLLITRACDVLFLKSGAKVLLFFHTTKNCGEKMQLLLK